MPFLSQPVSQLRREWPISPAQFNGLVFCKICGVTQRPISISGGSRWDYALRMDSLVSPAASSPRSRETGNRRFRIQGLPVATTGSIVIRSKSIEALRPSNNDSDGSGLPRHETRSARLPDLPHAVL